MPAAAQPQRDKEDSLRSKSDEPYSAAVNPYWVRLLKLLQMDVRYERCIGTELFTADGRRIVDFLSGYCVHNLGHNHPAIIEAVKDELDRCGPTMLQSHVPELAGYLAQRLCALAGGHVKKAFFCSSGSEGIEAAIKFAKAHTKRQGLLYAQGAFHGLTCGALSIMGDQFWKQGFGTLLPGTQQIPFSDVDALERELETRKYAALFLEPIQGEAGIRVTTRDYLAQAKQLCKRYGTLLVLDEVQTGFCRTGKFLAAHHSSVDADMIVLAKAMSGGLVASGAVLMTDAIYDSVYGSLRKSLIHTSTYSENGLAMRVGLAVLDALEREQCELQASVMGTYMRQRLRQSLAGFEMVEEIRGEGLFCGIVFRPPQKLSLRLPFKAFTTIHPAMFGQVAVMRLFRDHGILAQICGNNFMVLKAAPPLIVQPQEIDFFVDAVSAVVELMHSPGTFWNEALGIAGRAANI